MPLEFTAKGYIEVWRDGEKLSQHRQEREALEAVSRNGPGTYRITYPDVEVVSRLDIVVYPQDTTPPTVPVITSVTTVSTSRLDVTWAASSDSGSGVNGYKVYSSTTSGGTYTLLETVSSASLTYSHTGLSASTTRWYKVSAIDVQGNESAQSSASSGTTSSQGGEQTLLTEADFSYEGYYDIPLTASGSGNGLTVRRDGSNVYLIIQNSPDPGVVNPYLYEYLVTGKSYGDSLGSPVWSYEVTHAYFAPGNAFVGWQGIYWDETTSRLWMNSCNDYSDDGAVKIIYYPRSGSTMGTPRGPFRLEGITANRVNSGFMELPSSLQTLYGCGRIVTGLGGYTSQQLSNQAALGPTMLALPDDIDTYSDLDEIPLEDFVRVMNLAPADPGDRNGQWVQKWRGYTFTQTTTIDIPLDGNAETPPTTYLEDVPAGTIEGGGPIVYVWNGDPHPNGLGVVPTFLPLNAAGTFEEGVHWGELDSDPGLAHWGFLNRIAGMFAVDTASRRGIVAACKVTVGKNWYENSDSKEDGACVEIHVIDPDDLVDCAGTSTILDSWLECVGLRPTSIYDCAGEFTVIQKNQVTSAWDPVDSLLYIKIGKSDGTSRVHVYSVNT